MAVEIVKLMQGVLTVKVTGELSEQDIGQLQSAAKRVIGQWIKVRMLMILDGFCGWAPAHLDDGAGFFKVVDFSAFDKIAVIGDRRHEEGTSFYFSKNLPGIAVNYFPLVDHDDAVNLGRRRAMTESIQMVLYFTGLSKG